LWQFSPFFVAVLAVAIAETRSRTSPIALTQVRQRTPFGEKKVAENAASRPNFGDFCLPARSLAAVVGLSWGGDTAAPHHRAIITTIVEVQEQMEQFKFTFNIGVPQRLHH